MGNVMPPAVTLVLIDGAADESPFTCYLRPTVEATLRFASTLANPTLALTSGELAVNQNIAIDAPGVPSIALSGNFTEASIPATGAG